MEESTEGYAVKSLSVKYVDKFDVDNGDFWSVDIEDVIAP